MEQSVELEKKNISQSRIGKGSSAHGRGSCDKCHRRARADELPYEEGVRRHCVAVWTRDRPQVVDWTETFSDCFGVEVVVGWRRVKRQNQVPSKYEITPQTPRAALDEFSPEGAAGLLVIELGLRDLEEQAQRVDVAVLGEMNCCCS